MDIEDRYTRRILAMYIPNYAEFREKVEEIDTVIVLSREHRENRIAYYDEILRNHLPEVARFSKSVDAAEMSMNEELERERQLIETEERRHQEIVSGLNKALADASHEAGTNRTYFYISLAINVLLALVSIGLGIAALK